MGKHEITFESDKIGDVAREFLSISKGCRIFTFSGELSAGKTTFISALCRELGVEEIVSSPTFAIIQQYSTTGGENIYHIDLYRIRNEEEAISSGIEDCLLSTDICMVEWPENAPGIIPTEAINTTIHISGNEQRKLVISLPE